MIAELLELGDIGDARVLGGEAVDLTSFHAALIIRARVPLLAELREL